MPLISFLIAKYKPNSFCGVGTGVSGAGVPGPGVAGVAGVAGLESAVSEGIAAIAFFFFFLEGGGPGILFSTGSFGVLQKLNLIHLRILLIIKMKIRLDIYFHVTIYLNNKLNSYFFIITDSK